MADDVSSNNGLWDTFLLNFGWMFKSAVNDGSVELVFKQKVLETGTVNSSIGGHSIKF